MNDPPYTEAELQELRRCMTEGVEQGVTPEEQIRYAWFEAEDPSYPRVDSLLHTLYRALFLPLRYLT